MKRHAALQDLSRDHHTALQRVLRVRRGDADGAARLRDLAEGPLRLHLDEEDALLLPWLEGQPEAIDVVERWQADHAFLRQPMGNPGDYADRLEAHIRWEERTAFPLLEAIIPAAGLMALQAAQDAFRRDRGMPVGPA